MDEKARKILFDYFWSPAGWKTNREINADDLKYVISAGYMFNPVVLTHNEG